MSQARAGAGALAGHVSPAATGLLLTATIAIAARFLGAATPLPAIVFALALGMAFAGLGSDGRCAAGVELSARTILRIGIALLGLQITLSDMVALGPATAAIVLAALFVTLVLGQLVARWFGAQRECAMISAGAVAICGASAALAIAAALPHDRVREEEVARTVAGVTIAGTLAMLALPPLAFWLGLDPVRTGILLGGSIHEVAQAAAAGFAVSDAVGQVATIVKLLRVASLGLVVLAIGLIVRNGGRGASGASGAAPPLLPAFLLWFVLLALLSSLGIVPEALRQLAGEVSRWCLLIAIAALGVRTSFARLVTGGSRPMLAIGANSLLLTGLVLAGLLLIG